MPTSLPQLIARQDGRCYYCQAPFGRGHYPSIDHLTPRCRGGGNADDNRRAACWRCNAAKGPLTEPEFRAVRHDPAALIRERQRVNRLVSEANRLGLRQPYRLDAVRDPAT